MRKKQLDFFDHDPDLKPGRLAHGGEHIGRGTGRRRLARPLNAKKTASSRIEVFGREREIEFSHSQSCG